MKKTVINMMLGKRIKKILIITASIIAFLIIYTVAFQSMFGASRRPESYCTLPKEGQGEYVQGIIDSMQDDNAAKYYLMAGLELAPSPRDDAFWDRFMTVIEEGWQGDDPELEKYIVDNKAALELIDKGTQQNRYSFPFIGVGDDLFYLADARHFARLLVVKGRYLGDKGQFKEAADTYLNLLRFSADIADNGPLTNVTTGSALEGLAYMGLDSLIARLDDAAVCENLLKELIGIEKARVPLSKLIENEHAYSRKFQEHLAGQVFATGIVPDDPNFIWYFLDAIGRTNCYLSARFSLRDRLEEVDTFFQYVVEVSEQPYPEMLRKPIRENAPTGELMEGMSEIMDPFIYLTARDETRRHATIIRVALQLRVLEGGVYPETTEELSEIVPEEMLIDPFSEKNFVYRKTDDGYLLYSLGGDMDDDGGMPDQPPWNLGDDGDIVFEPPVAVTY